MYLSQCDWYLKDQLENNTNFAFAGVLFMNGEHWVNTENSDEQSHLGIHKAHAHTDLTRPQATPIPTWWDDVLVFLPPLHNSSQLLQPSPLPLANFTGPVYRSSSVVLNHVTCAAIFMRVLSGFLSVTDEVSECCAP